MRKAMPLLFLIVLSAGAQAQSLKERMIGTWKLVSWNVVAGGAEKPGPMSKGAIGIITYSPDGYMCVNIMEADRPKSAASSLNEKSGAYDTFVGYCGRYEVNENERFVTHLLDTSSLPNWTGSAQKRFVELSAGQIKLTTPPINSQVHVLIWERAK